MTLDSGLEPMPDEVAIQALQSVIGQDAPVRSTIVAADWSRLATAYRTRAALHIVDDMLPTDADSDTSSMLRTEFREALRDCEPTRRRDLLVDHVTAQVAAAMGLASPQLLDPSAGFFQSGMDSLMSVTLQRSLSKASARCYLRLSCSTIPPSKRLPTIWPQFFPSWSRLPIRRVSTPTTTSPMMSCCNSSPKGWVELDGCCTAGSSGDHHRGAAQDR